MDKKIMICGASGTGKTTLAQHMAELYELPYVTTSASQLWKKYGFDSHKDALSQCLANPSIGFRYQLDILTNRKAKLSNLSNYVTDRSYVDNITYILLQLGHGITQGNLGILLHECHVAMQGVDGLIFLRWNKDIILENNGKRVMNRIYHEMVDNTMVWVLNSKMVICPILELPMWDFETRIELVDKWIKRSLD